MKMVTLGVFAAPFGVKGWVKVFSHTEPFEKILSYAPWQVSFETAPGQYKTFEVLEGRAHQGKLVVVRLKGIDDRDQAANLRGGVIQVDSSLLPQLDDGDFYWHQLEGLQVFTVAGECLGEVESVMPTGANDVLVVKPSAESIDGRERLLPYVLEQFVVDVDLAAKRITVDWDIDF